MFLDEARMLTLAGLAAVVSRSRWLKGLNFKWAKVRWSTDAGSLRNYNNEEETHTSITAGNDSIY